MEMKELFESTFYEEVPEIFYLIGDCYTLYAIVKTRSNLFSLYVFDVNRKERIPLKAGKFDELMDISQMLTYSFSTVYYERCPE